MSGLKLGGGQLVAPLVSGDTSVPGTLASFAGSWAGCPFALIPFVQFSESMCFDVSRCSPVTRSSRKKWPLRLACASILRGRPLKSPSISTGVCAASQSCVSCGVTW